MRFWRNLLGGLLLWTAHFFAVYIIASLLPGAPAAAILVLLVTAVILALTLWLLVRTVSAMRRASDDLQRWSSVLALLGYALAAIAVIYQGLPAAIS